MSALTTNISINAVFTELVKSLACLIPFKTCSISSRLQASILCNKKYFSFLLFSFTNLSWTEMNCYSLKLFQLKKLFDCNFLLELLF